MQPVDNFRSWLIVQVSRSDPGVHRGTRPDVVEFFLAAGERLRPFPIRTWFCQETRMSAPFRGSRF